MAENKRFTVPLKYCLSHSKIQCDGTQLTNDELVRILNTNDGAFIENFNLKKENKELKEAYTKLKHNHSNLHDMCIDIECERDSLKKDVNFLEEQNKKLKIENELLSDELKQSTAVIAKKWNEYLKKKELSE